MAGFPTPISCSSLPMFFMPLQELFTHIVFAKRKHRVPCIHNTAVSAPAWPRPSGPLGRTRLGLVMLMPEFMRSNLVCGFSLSDASLLLVAAVFPLISKFLTYLHHVPIKSRPYLRITLKPQRAGAKASTREEQVEVVQNWTFFPWIVEQEA